MASPVFFWGFLFGIALHSLYPRTPFELIWLFVAASMAGVAVLYLRDRREVITPILLLGLCLGLIRFELARPDLPTTLRAFDPNAFAYQLDASSGFIADTRSFLSSRIQTLFPGDSGRLLAGYLYGERKLSQRTKEEVRRAGLTHLVAVSGGNVTMLFLALGRVLKPLHWSKRKRFVALSIALAAFVLLVSPQAPVMRAAVMATLIMLAPLVGRIPDTKHLLLVAAFVFTMWRPESMFFDPSFILSFLAMLGLFSFGSLIATWIEERTRSAFFGELIGATLGATLFTTPYSMWAFGNASAIGIVANMFAVPLVPWTLIAGSFALVVSLPPFVFFAELMLQATLGIARLTSMVPHGAWNNVVVSPWFMLGCYVAIAMAWKTLNRKDDIHRKLSDKTRMSVRSDEMNAMFFT
ncbi:MAG: ComEC/Rec2 family competence protein [Patescibacteria group bacterium]